MKSDRKNPRTADRPLPKGLVARNQVLMVAWGGIALFLFACGMLNPLFEDDSWSHIYHLGLFIHKAVYLFLSFCFGTCAAAWTCICLGGDYGGTSLFPHY